MTPQARFPDVILSWRRALSMPTLEPVAIGFVLLSRGRHFNEAVRALLLSEFRPLVRAAAQ